MCLARNPLLITFGRPNLLYDLRFIFKYQKMKYNATLSHRISLIKIYYTSLYSLHSDSDIAIEPITTVILISLLRVVSRQYCFLFHPTADIIS